MRKDDLPQDSDSFYDGALRACYATDDQGRYVMATSQGWKVETLATRQAIEDLEQKLEATRQAVLGGELSSLAFHMQARMMTRAILAQSTGLLRFRVKRHMRPTVFARLSDRLLGRYSEALDISVEALKSVPDRPVRLFSERGDDDRT